MSGGVIIQASSPTPTSPVGPGSDTSSALSVIDKMNDLMKRAADKRTALVTKTEALARLREEAKGSNFFSSWLNNTDDKIKDGQLDLMSSLSDLQSVSVELLEANATISRVLLDQQGVLLKQQAQLDEQTGLLQEQGRRLDEQQRVHQAKVEEMLDSNRDLDRASREAMELAEQLMAGIAEVGAAEQQLKAEVTDVHAAEQRLAAGITDVRAAEQRLDARADSRYDDLGAQIRRMRWGVVLALLIAAASAALPLLRG